MTMEHYFTTVNYAIIAIQSNGVNDSPCDPEEWLVSNFSLQYHPLIKR